MNKNDGKKKNILLIISDQHNRNFMGNAGYDVDTPHLDLLASEGTRFNSAYTGSPLCVPARMSFVTGRYPTQIGIYANHNALSSTEPTFAHAIGAAGYETALIGRMHFVGADQNHGFEKRLVGDIGSEWVGQGNNLGPFIYNSGAQVSALHNSGPGITSHQYFDKRVSQAACEELADWKHRKDSVGARPFCHVVGMHLPHSPFRAPVELYRKYLDRVKLPDRNPINQQSGYVEHYHKLVGVDKATEEDERRALAAYCAMTEHLDQCVGQVLEQLDAIGERDNTLVIYTSDHGDHAGAHCLWWKQSFHEESAGIPMLIAGPGIDAGKQIDTPVSLVDMSPTLIDFCDGDPLPEQAGQSLLPLLHGESFNADRAIYSELAPWNIAFTSRMVRKGDYKLIYYHTDEVENELYNLADDPTESNNLFEDASHQAARDELVQLLTADGWDADDVDCRARKSMEKAKMLGSWFKAVRPESKISYVKTLPVSVNQPQDHLL